MSFTLNDKVVCVTSGHRFGQPHQYCHGFRLVEGQVYVVRDIWAHARAKEGVLVQLVGCPEKCTPREGIRMGWAPSRFRLVSEVGHPAIERKANYGTTPAAALGGEDFKAVE